MAFKMGKQVMVSVAAVAAVLIIVATLGLPLPLSPFTKYHFDGPICADTDGNTTVVVDSDSRRLLVLDGQDRLRGSIDFTSYDSPIEAVTSVCVSGDTIYVAGAKYHADSEVIEKERVLSYTLGGRYINTVYEKGGIDTMGVTIAALCDAPDGALMVRMVGEFDEEAEGSKWAYSASFAHMNSEGIVDERKVRTNETNVYDVGCSPIRGEQVYLDGYGLFNWGDGKVALSDHVFTSIDLGDNGLVYACEDLTGAICTVSRDNEVVELVPGDGYTSVHANGNWLAMCDREQNKVSICRLDGSELRSITHFDLALRPLLQVLLFWVCVAFLVGLALFLAVRRVRTIIASGEAGNIGAMFASVAVVAAVGMAIGSFAYTSYQHSQETRANEVGFCADYLQAMSMRLSDPLEHCSYRNALRDADSTGEVDEAEIEAAQIGLIEVFDVVYSLTSTAWNNNIGLYCVVYGKDDQGVFYMIDSASERVFGSSVSEGPGLAELEAAFNPETIGSHEMLTGRTLRDATQYRLVPITSNYDYRHVVGVIEVGSKMRSFAASQLADLGQRILALLVMVMVLYLCYSELRGCGRCLLSYRSLRERRASDAVAVLTRPFTFCITTLVSIDSVMTVLIARDLLQGTGMADTSSLLALPAIMLGLGMVIGQAIYGLLGSRVPLRRFVVRGALLMMACAVFTALSVSSGQFWLYCIAKLTMSIPFGMLYTLGYSLPRVAETEETRKTAAAGVLHTDTSAAAFGMVLGGYAAQVMGNAWVYVLVAIATFPVLLMAFSLLPRDADPLEEDVDPNEVESAVRFVRSRTGLTLAFFMILPVALATGYSSFLFPVFSADAGLQKADINNIVVIGQIVVFACISVIAGLRRRVGAKRVSCVALAGLGVSLLLLFFNTTLAWAGLLVVVVAVLAKCVDGWKGLWLKAAEDMGVHAGRATSAMFAVRSTALVAQPFILGSLLAMGVRFAIIAIGAYFLTAAYLFWRSKV